MQPTNPIYLAVSAMRPGRLRVMLNKVWKRIADRRGTLSQERNMEWLRSQAVDFQEVARSLDPVLWAEAEEYARRLDAHADAVLSQIPYDLGGGGAYPFLYFLTRLRRPKVVVETGVAAGYSSHAFLSALNDNGEGRLYSSDFPYFRLPNPERFVGVLVNEELRGRWELFIDGDEANIPRILSRVERVDLVHYDSDKSYSGRVSALARLQPRMAPGGIILMDDLHDNSHFHDLVTSGSAGPWSVLDFRGKYVGVLGELGAPAT